MEKQINKNKTKQKLKNISNMDNSISNFEKIDLENTDINDMKKSTHQIKSEYFEYINVDNEEYNINNDDLLDEQ